MFGVDDAVVAGVGLGLSAYGAYGQMQAAGKKQQAQEGIIQGEMQADLVRNQAMNLDANRRQLEIVRQQQRARSLALAHATSGQGQGAQSSSGIFGGWGQIAGQAGFNWLGVEQNRQFGNQLFGINQQINQGKIQLSRADADMAQAQAFTQLGGAILSNATPLSTVGKQAMGLFGSAGGTPDGMGMQRSSASGLY